MNKWVYAQVREIMVDVMTEKWTKWSGEMDGWDI